MALVEFQNNSAPYINADNLNNNFEYLDNKVDGEEWHNMVLINNWGTYESNYQKAQYKKIGNQVFLRGLVFGGTASTDFVQLPEGYRPLLNNYLAVCDDVGGNLIRVYPDGKIKAYSYTNYISLTGTSFFID